ncbi:MAG: PHP domain-containing protein, partial [Bacteroidetes bacterium]|nr:PHP domain-containing protein [Bacteroidota bacterium]
MVIADLHAHTIYSDGSLTPHELIKKAKNLGIEYLGITDHDTI